MSASDQRRDWDEIAALDPYWAVLSDPDRKHGGWDRGAFFATGETEVAEVLEAANRLGRPSQRRAALDFGCGVGRAAPALARRFDRYVGVDVSGEMVARARELHGSVENCKFAVVSDGLAGFRDGSFDLVYSQIVLQHLPSPSAIFACIGEFTRVLRADGLAVFQLPSAVPLLIRAQPRRTLWVLLRRLGLSPAFLYRRLGLHPMRMRGVAKESVARHVEASGGTVLELREGKDASFGFSTVTYYVARA